MYIYIYIYISIMYIYIYIYIYVYICCFIPPLDPLRRGAGGPDRCDSGQPGGVT